MKIILFPLGVLCAALAFCNGIAALMLAALPVLACVLFAVLAVGLFIEAYELDQRGNGAHGETGANGPQKTGATLHIPGNRCRD